MLPGTSPSVGKRREGRRRGMSGAPRGPELTSHAGESLPHVAGGGPHAAPRRGELGGPRGAPSSRGGGRGRRRRRPGRRWRWRGRRGRGRACGLRVVWFYAATPGPYRRARRPPVLPTEPLLHAETARPRGAVSASPALSVAPSTHYPPAIRAFRAARRSLSAHFPRTFRALSAWGVGTCRGAYRTSRPACRSPCRRRTRPCGKHPGDGDGDARGALERSRCSPSEPDHERIVGRSRAERDAHPSLAERVLERRGARKAGERRELAISAGPPSRIAAQLRGDVADSLLPLLPLDQGWWTSLRAWTPGTCARRRCWTTSTTTS